MSNLFFVQMSGAPGSGKTTIARAIANATGAVVIDHDVTKSALLAAEVPVALAGRASYQLLDALARHLLKQGHSVIFDSPCFYEELLARGQQLAQEHGATYRYIECILHVLDELDRRLRTRERMRSQVAGVYAPTATDSGTTTSGEQRFRNWIANMKRPKSNYLTIDTTQSIERCTAQAIQYITHVASGTRSV